MKPLLHATRLAAASACALLGSCAYVEPSWVPFSAAAQAQDQIMLVRKEPPSFGFLRLETQAQIYPDLVLFVQKRGIPDFLAETGDRDQHYLIFYYLKPRQAFACRTRPGHPGALEFAGPYPVTPGEHRLLESFRRGLFR